MKLYNFLRCGYTFSPEEYELETRYILTTAALIMVSFVLFFVSIIYYITGDMKNVVLHSIGVLLSVFTIYIVRKIGKNNYTKLVYTMSILFLSLILYGYYYDPMYHPVSTWIIIQILVSFLVLNVTAGAIIGIVFSVFIIFMNNILEYNSLQYILLKITPVFIGIVLIYMIEKKFVRTILLLEDSNKHLEERVQRRTQEIQSEKDRLDYQANYDFLTKLPNRNNFQNEIQKWINSDKDKKLKFSLFYIDLDRFKRVNDSLGHTIGDKVLQMVAIRVKNLIDEKTFFARISGDEFTLLSRLTEEKEVRKLVTKLIEVIEKPIVLSDNKLYISASIGISRYPENSVYYADLIQYADTSMFEAKLIGRGTYKFYADEMTHKVTETVLMETEMHRALDEHEFVLFYQPQIDIRTEDVSGIEVLVRWNHPTHGLLSPYKFILLAEETGMIISLDYYVLKKGMEQIVHWKKDGVVIPRISFNFSTKHLQENIFIDVMKNLMHETGCKAEWIELEITESHIMSNVEESVSILNSLRELGITIAIDDFGTGYSSLSYLKSLPTDKIKIDKSFIDNITEDEVDKTIIKAIIDIAYSIGLTVVAEGVETEEQRDYLYISGCNHIQGYFYYKPMDSLAIEKNVLRK